MRLIIWRAVKETRVCFDWAHKWVWICVALATTPMAWVYLWGFGQGKAVYGEMNIAAATLAAIATIALVIFLINLCRAPILIIKERDCSIEILQTEKTELQQAMRPKLSIIHRAHANPWLQVSQAQQADSHLVSNGYLYTYRISLSNTGVETIRNLRVRIASIMPPELRGAPHHLHFTNDNVQPYAEMRDLPMTVDEASGLFVDVITYWRGGEQSQRMSFFHTANGVSGSVAVQTYEFVVVVSSDNGGTTIQQRCRFTPTLDAAPLLEFI